MTTGKQVARTPMQDNDAGASTIGEYLIRLAQEVWQEGEGFSGKRPFGNSGWDWDIYQALALAGLISYEGTVENDEGYIWIDARSYDEEAGNKLIDKAFAYLMSKVNPKNV